MPGLLLAILGLASSAWGHTQQQNKLQRLQEEIGLASAGVRTDVTKGYKVAERALKRGFKQAQKALEDGNDEAAAQILKGLGLATEEINKWADVAHEGMQWVVDFGKEGMVPARAYLDEMSEAIMNPEAIWQSSLWKQYKTEVMDSLTNAYSGSKGVMHSGTWAAMADRLGKDALTVRNNYIQSLQTGLTAENWRIGLGAKGSEWQGSLRSAQGVNLANLISGAYNQIGRNESAYGTSLANLQSSQGTNLANLFTDRTTDLANLDLGLATQLANIQLAGMQENPWTNLGTTAITAGTNLMMGDKSTAATGSGIGSDPGIQPVQLGMRGVGGRGSENIVPTWNLPTRQVQQEYT